MQRKLAVRWLMMTLALTMLCSGVCQADEDGVRIALGTSRELAAREKIGKALNSEIELKAEALPLRDLADYVKNLLNVSVQLDEKSLEAANISADSQVNCNVSKISARAALKLALKKLDADFVIRDESLTITSREDAANYLDVRVYPVRDLVTVKTDDATSEDYETLIEVIQAAIVDSAWDSSGGTAKVRALPSAGSIVITQTSDAQDQIANLLEALRKSKALPSNSK